MTNFSTNNVNAGSNKARLGFEMSPDSGVGLLDSSLLLRDECDNGVPGESDIRIADGMRQADFKLGNPNHYLQYAESDVLERFNMLAEYLDKNSIGASQSDIDASLHYVQTAFDLFKEFQEGKGSESGVGNFAFVVPIRMSRKHPEYASEVEPIIPILKHVPAELRADFLKGLPPTIIDYYSPKDSDRRGYLVFAPIFADMLDDLSPMDAYNAAIKGINDTVDFSHRRLGAEVVGLGATIPAITNYGKTIDNKEVILTTGHGGTAHLVKETVGAAIEDGHVNADTFERIGVLGLGSIGASIADLVRGEYPDLTLNLFDKKGARTESQIDRLASLGYDKSKLRQAKTDVDLIAESDVILSAIVGKIDLSDTESKSRLDLNGKMIIDDSQPASFDSGDVARLGGKLAWVIGYDESGIVGRRKYDYASMLDPSRDVFGCEAEAASLSALSEELREAGYSNQNRAEALEEAAVQDAVTPEKARRMGSLMDRLGIIPSQLQAYGRPLKGQESLKQDVA